MAGSVLERRFLVILICSLILMGCRDKNDRQANAEAAEAATSLSKIRADLTRAKRNLADSTEELQAVKNIRDELDKQVAQLTAERDNAIKAALAAEQKTKDLASQVSEMPDSLSSLEKELTAWRFYPESQRPQGPAILSPGLKPSAKRCSRMKSLPSIYHPTSFPISNRRTPTGCLVTRSIISRENTTTAAYGLSFADFISPPWLPPGNLSSRKKKLLSLAKLVQQPRVAEVEFGFNEWHRAQNGTPQGQDWQSWSAAMYLYAAACVEQKRTPFFKDVRDWPKERHQQETTASDQ